MGCDGQPFPSHWGRPDVPKSQLDGTEIKFGALEYSEDLWIRIDGARIHVLDGAGHYLIWEEPDATVQKNRKFMNEIQKDITGQRVDMDTYMYITDKEISRVEKRKLFQVGQLI